MNQNFNYSNSFGFDQIQPQQQFDNHQPQEIPEVIPFFDSETRNELYKMMEDFTERMNQELHKQEVLLAAQREQELLAQKQAAQEKQVPSPNSVFRQLIEEMCGTKVCEDQKQNMEDTMLDLLEICRQKELYCMHNNVEDLIESALNSKLLLINLNSQHLDKEKQEESTIPLNEIISQLPPSIAIMISLLVLPTVEPEDSLIMGDEILSTIPKKESDEVIKSSVEDLVPIPSESEDTSDNDTLLVTPLFDANEDECFDPGGDIDEIDADVSTDIEDDYHDSEGDIIYLKSLLINDTIPNLHSEVFLDDDPKSLNDEPNIDDLKIKENVRFTFEDRHYLSLTFVIKIFLPFLTYPLSSLLLSSESEDTIFDPGISAYSFYSLEPVAYESSIMIFPFFCFYPKDKGIRG
ncbi:hypothetical protein Tco_0615294, partial [Tanacetum coccineum]